MADAEAISEAAQRPTMRFVTPKSAESQVAAIVFRTRDLLVRRRTQLINALHSHLPEFGAGHAAKLFDLVADPSADLPNWQEQCWWWSSRAFRRYRLKSLCWTKRLQQGPSRIRSLSD